MLIISTRNFEFGLLCLRKDYVKIKMKMKNLHSKVLILLVIEIFHIGFFVSPRFPASVKNYKHLTIHFALSF